MRDVASVLQFEPIMMEVASVLSPVLADGTDHDAVGDILIQR
jgi:hypothetical protein